MSLLGLPLDEEKLSRLNMGIKTQAEIHDQWFDLLYTFWEWHVLRGDHAKAKMTFEQIWEMKRILQTLTDDI
jgi:hypothetical protein